MSNLSDTPTFASRRAELQDYFDRTAFEAWRRLTSDAPVSRIRETVRRGRDDMRATILSWLPADLGGLRLLDAGCGTGALAVEAARRGAEVVAIDVARGLVEVAAERAPAATKGLIEWRAGDMLDPALGRFDHVVAMDSLIHYATPDMVRAVAALAARTRGSVIFTFAPRTALLSAMHLTGRLFPRADRAPAIVPAPGRRLAAALAGEGLKVGRTRRIACGFYTSQALEVLAP
ncbi:magnesium protoporphyrin IX methyltransferase [Limibaculum sp. FT325]|uniref:magnesium protoporphyrin IX methyltransferase n=1 Tax=Thermohalobaculum sediminis TaxID=2939436 RepID=UPI0020C091FF|nr:magnesium protoporphyrin IX methyltransferase [Limibaculum sediminis]MCL5778607.1 magnesium protoporphyrin IX methyltransferase [Limibaculum sediminis]